MNREIDAYWRLLSKVTPLTREQEVTLAKERNFKELVAGSLRYIPSLARRYVHPHVSLIDLIAEGNLAMVMAAPLYNYESGYRFGTFACQRAKWEMSRLSKKKRCFETEVQIDFELGESEDKTSQFDLDKMEKIIEGLSDRREWQLMKLMGQGLDQAEIARRFDVSRQRVGQIRERAFRRVRERMGLSHNEDTVGV